IQPHGVLLVLSPKSLSSNDGSDPDWTLVQVSQNTAEYLGKSPESLINQPLSVILSVTARQSLQQCIAGEFEAVNPLKFSLDIAGEPQSFAGVVHQSEDWIVLELEPSQDSGAVNFFDFYGLVKQPVSRIQQTQTLQELCQVAVEEFKQVTGFDRVMVYQFSEDGSGTVFAEKTEPGLTPFLGLHYPATDIPKQSQHLYLLNMLRMIPTVTYEPVPLFPSHLPDKTLLDMSFSGLRSVSPLHIEYLQNMGVQATLTISLVQNNQLWGMVVCHHNSSLKLPYERRAICEFLGQVIALEITTKSSREGAEYRLQLKALQASFVETLSQSPSLIAGLTQTPDQLMALTGSSGAAFCEKGEKVLLGQTPSSEQMIGLISWLGNQFGPDNIYHTAELSRVYPPAADFDHGVSGLVAIAISQPQQLYVVWFRPEVLQTVNWAGNPEKAVKEVDENGGVSLSPRQSFDLWKQTVRQRSLPWKPCELEAASELRSSVVGLVLQRADELSALNSELARSNVELDSFAYIASHDLKEPLRGIHNYSSFLIEDYGDVLGEDGADKLNTLMRLTQRMEDLINSLLHYSRLGRADLVMAPVDLNDIVRGVVDMVKIGKSEAVRLEIVRSLPTTDCARTQVTELFTNLITNGIKYNDKPQKWVEVGYLSPAEALLQGNILPDNLLRASISTEGEQAVSRVGSPIFYVRDNGIGIREKHIETVFRIFKRLHSPTRYGGGTGAGLTIAKKIIERHGGQLWVRSVYGEGSTFYFTLKATTDE
ncbi:MAG: ATP-binding protein, partial [Cyanobacteria bacterium J06598_1]